MVGERIQAWADRHPRLKRLWHVAGVLADGWDRLKMLGKIAAAGFVLVGGFLVVLLLLVEGRGVLWTLAFLIGVAAILVGGMTLLANRRRSEPDGQPIRSAITMDKFYELREASRPKIADADLVAFIHEGEALEREKITSLEERESWNKRYDAWRLKASEQLHSGSPHLAREFLEAGRVEDELPTVDWEGFDAQHQRILALLRRGLTALGAMRTADPAIAEAYQRGTDRPRTQVTKLTTLKSLIGEWAETDVTNAKVEFIAEDQYPLARDIASIFESWSPQWKVTFYDKKQDRDSFEGIRVEGFLTALVNAVVDGLQTDVPGMPIEPIYQQIQIDAGNPKYSNVLKSIRVSVGYRPQGWSSAGDQP